MKETDLLALCPAEGTTTYPHCAGHAHAFMPAANEGYAAFTAQAYAASPFSI